MEIPTAIFTPWRQEARPEGPPKEIIKAIVEMKQRNPRYGCPRITQQINLAFGLDQTFFWTAADLENKLPVYQRYYNVHRPHSGRAGATPVESGGNNKVIDTNHYRWESHCRGLFELPVAA